MSAETVVESIPPGYKQTEMGVIPEDWQTPTLERLTILMTNGFVGTATTHYAINENGILYIQGYNVEENSFNFHGIKYVTKEFHSVHMKSCLKGGDLLTVQTGDVGLTTIVPESLAGSNCHALIISRFDHKQVISAFISYYLNSKPGRSRLKLIETGTTMKHLNVGDMLQFTVPLPPTLAEQEAIATALSDTDALIESLEQLIAKKRQIKQGAMQELLTGKRRLPGFEIKRGYKHTEIGMLPEDWEPKPLESFTVVTSGKRLPLGQSLIDNETSHPYIRVTDMRPGTVFLDDIKFVPVEVFPKISRYRIFKDDIFISVAGTLGIVGKVPPQLDGANLTENADRITNINGSQDYLLHVLMSPLIQNAIDSLQTVGAQPKLALTRIRKFVIPLPPTKDEQEAIATILSDMDAEITSLEEKLAKTRQVKQGMMQELLTGRIRLI